MLCAMAVTREESLLLEQRLLLHESAVNKPSVHAVGVRFGQLAAATSAEEIDSEADDLIRESLRLSLEFSKQIRSLKAGEQQLKDYSVFEQEQQKSVEAKKKTLHGLEEELTHEKQLRRHREEVEKRAALVNQQASRGKLAENLATRKRAIEELVQQRTDVHSKIVAKQQKIAELTSEVQCLASVAVAQKK